MPKASLKKNSPYQSHSVLEHLVSEDGFDGFCLKIYKSEAMLHELAKIICDAIPEYALGYHAGAKVPIHQLVPRLKEAFTRIHDGAAQQTKGGDIGEIILHIILRDWYQSEPLLSKIYFKDSAGSAIHGFDALHVTTANGKSELWFGESKLYDDGASGIESLIKDIQAHASVDCLESECIFISSKLALVPKHLKKLATEIKEKNFVKNNVDKIVIPMLCTYTSTTYRDVGKPFKKAILAELASLAEQFHKKKGSPAITVLLILLPISSKKDLLKTAVNLLHGLKEALGG